MHFIYVSLKLNVRYVSEMGENDNFFQPQTLFFHKDHHSTMYHG